MTDFSKHQVLVPIEDYNQLVEASKTIEEAREDFRQAMAALMGHLGRNPNLITPDTRLPLTIETPTHTFNFEVEGTKKMNTYFRKK